MSTQKIIINIGAPRTGTTTIQAHALKLIKRNHAMAKRPGTSDNFLTKNGKWKLSGKQIIDFTRSITSLENRDLGHEISGAIRTLAIASSPTKKCEKDIPSELLKILMSRIQETSSMSILIHDERLCDCGASLDGNSIHKVDTRFAIYPLVSALSSLNEEPLITLCLRNPIPYLRSKYLRTLLIRKSKNLPFIAPNKYIRKQSILETTCKGTSAIAPAMHTEFIKQLQKHAFVKAFGFQELLASDDIFSLMGLQGEDKYAFRDFPRENKLPFSKEQEQAIEAEITQALKQYGFYDRIMKAQMFE